MLKKINKMLEVYAGLSEQRHISAQNLDFEDEEFVNKYHEYFDESPKNAINPPKADIDEKIPLAPKVPKIPVINYEVLNWLEEIEKQKENLPELPTSNQDMSTIAPPKRKVQVLEEPEKLEDTLREIKEAKKLNVDQIIKLCGIFAQME